MIHWRPATADDIGMPCRFHDGDSSNRVMYGQLTDIGSDMPFRFERDRYFVYKFAEVAERERNPIEDPILDVRVAVVDALTFWKIEFDPYAIAKTVADKLPPYFRQKLYTE